MKRFLFLLLCLTPILLYAQEKVSFLANDGLKITADLYLSDFQKPFIILLHQAESSRGEYKEIAPKLNKLGYNCLAVDLRAGQKSNFVKNETAQRALKEKYATRFIEARKDIEAAISYVKKYNEKPVVLFGSSYSASLALIIAEENERVSSVVAFSPGEYFRPELNVKDNISGVSQPLFIASSELEYNYVKELTSIVGSKEKMLFKPAQSRGTHGAKALWEESEGSSEYWLVLTQFFSRLKQI